ncbi:GCN5-related N-acetyltransferase [filamentous cyanobacterium CCP2]|nr:GCN5-related N-acetyltransferase [filamentous cyanobacterium CCP2]
MKLSFSYDPILSDRLFELLETAFPGIRAGAERIRTLGASWESVSTPFMEFQGEKAIAHVGVLELPLWMNGEPVAVGGIHGVCTHPQFRRRGYFRNCMTAALDYCASRYDLLMLSTSQPELYQPFGFQVVQEYAFTTSCATQGNNKFRLLDLQTLTDQQILHQLLEEREPVSNVLGVVHERAVFYFNECDRPLYYAEDLDLIAVMEIEDTQLKLYDLVWRSPCSLLDLLDCIPKLIQNVVFYFSPDRLEVEATSFPEVLESDSYLMVYGTLPIEEQQWMLPHSARC